MTSPIDLIPDFIPVLGLLDDLVLVPLGIALALRMIPPEVGAESREKARTAMRGGGPGGRAAAAIIVLVWLGIAAHTPQSSSAPSARLRQSKDMGRGSAADVLAARGRAREGA